ncbi:hypothetical protein [Candidatus Caldatribacterium sp.]|uniref:hypothetical protein n=1 Tax=Candidatus Caldatribacterium sp. TaxID=2282143 RepID=UPI003841A6A0|nr:hypothetical protein [Candidatus Caldatribacterium sp.]
MTVYEFLKIAKERRRLEYRKLEKLEVVTLDHLIYLISPEAKVEYNFLPSLVGENVEEVERRYTAMFDDYMEYLNTVLELYTTIVDTTKMHVLLWCGTKWPAPTLSLSIDLSSIAEAFENPKFYFTISSDRIYPAIELFATKFASTLPEHLQGCVQVDKREGPFLTEHRIVISGKDVATNFLRTYLETFSKSIEQAKAIIAELFTTELGERGSILVSRDIIHEIGR